MFSLAFNGKHLLPKVSIRKHRMHNIDPVDTGMDVDADTDVFLYVYMRLYVYVGKKQIQIEMQTERHMQKRLQTEHHKST